MLLLGRESGKIVFFLFMTKFFEKVTFNGKMYYWEWSISLQIFHNFDVSKLQYFMMKPLSIFGLFIEIFQARFLEKFAFTDCAYL